MSKFINLMMTATMVTSLNLTSITGVQAHDLYTKHHHHHHQVVRERHNNNNNDDAIIWGIIGLAAGAIIANAAADNARVHQAPRQRTIYPGVDYYPPRPTKIYNARTRTVPNVPLYEPWSQGWYNYCANTYRSFNSRKGTYRGYDGKNHFCVVKR